MKEIRNLSKIKLILGIFIIATAMLIFMPNVVNAAEVQTISNLEEYKNVMNSSSNTDEVSAKLTSDIDITGLDGSGNHDAISVYNNITLDLNGHKITTSTSVLKFWLHADSNITIKNGTIENIDAVNSNIIKISHISAEYNLNLTIDNVKFESDTYGASAVYMWVPEDQSPMYRQNITFNNVIFDKMHLAVNPNFDTYSFSNVKLVKASNDSYARLLYASYLTTEDVVATGQGIYYYNSSNELVLATNETTMDNVITRNAIYVRTAKTSPIQVSTKEDLIYALKFYPEADIKLVAGIDFSADYTLDEVFDITSTNKIIDLNGNTITVGPGFFKFNYAIEGAGLTITDSSSAKSGKIVGNPDGFNYIFELSSDMTTKSNGTFKINGGTYVGSKYNGIVDMTNLNVTATFENSIYQSPNLINYDNNCDVTYKVGNITLGGTNGNNIILAQNGNYYYKDILLPDNKAYGYDGSVETLIDSDNHRPTGYVVDQPGYIIIKPDEGFNVNATIDTLEYGYASHAGSSISIYNRGLNSLTISNVTVDSGNFIIDKTGLQNATVASKATNSEVKIKVQDNLNPGTYTGTITVTDTEGKTHTGTVSATVSNKVGNTYYVTNDREFKNAFEVAKTGEINTIKLANDVDAYVSYNTFYILKDLTIDLAGNTLNLGNASLDFRIGDSTSTDLDTPINLNIISSTSSRGKIISSDDRMIIYFIDTSTKPVNFKIDKVDAEGDTISTFVENANKKTVNVIIENSTIQQQELFYATTEQSKFNNIELSNVTFYYPTGYPQHKFGSGFSDGTTVGDIIGANQEVVVEQKDGTTFTPVNLTDLATININQEYANSQYDQIKVHIRAKEGFDVANVTLDELEYGYTTTTGKPISITNRGQDALQIASVQVSDNTKFQVIGTTQPTVNAGDTNSLFVVKAKEGLDAGTHEANIIVTDVNSKTYTATVRVTVNPKTINANITMDNWKYGQTASNPSITGLESLASGQYEILYNVKGSSTTTTTKPTTPGTYEVSVNSKDANYTVNGKAEFTIEKATLRLETVDKEAKYNGQYQTADEFRIILNGTQVGTKYSGGSNLSYSLLGEDKIKNVEFTGSGLRVSGSITTAINGSTLDIDNKDYYDVAISSGSLRITENNTTITIKPKNINREYHSSLGVAKPSEYEFTGSLAGSDRFEDVTYTGEREYVGTTETSISSYKIMNGDVDVTACYSNITKGKGNIVITPFNPAEPTPSMTILVGQTITKAQLEEEIDIENLTATHSGVGTYSLANGFTSDTEGNATLVYTVPAQDLNNDAINDVNSYTITVTITVSNKTNVNLTGITDNQEFTYDKTNKRPIGNVIYDASTINNSDLEYLFEGTGSTSYTQSSIAPKNAGTYKMTVKVKDSNSTYTGNLTVNFTINKKELTKPKIHEDDKEFIFNLSSWTPELIGFDSNLMSKSGDLSKTNVGNYTITISLNDKDNYTWSDGTNDLTLNWKINVNEIESIVSSEKDSISIYTYRKNWYYTYQTSYNPDDVNKFYTIDINGTSYDSIEPFVDAGIYTYTISLKDKVNTCWSDGTTTDKVGTMIINKAAGDTEEGYQIPTGLYGINGKKLSTVSLPSGFKWNSPDTIITDGMKKYTVTYTPNDTNNYNIKNDQVVTVTGIDEYSITTSVDGGNGLITNFTDKVNEWTEATVDFTPDTGYMIDSVKVNGTNITSTISNNKYVFEPKQDTTIVVKYKKIPFTITVEDVTGATVTPNGAVSVNYGDDEEFTIEVNKGYELVKVLVDSVDKTSSLVANKLTLTNITKNMNVKVVVKEIKYEVTEGNNQKYTITKDSEAKFSIDADYTLFKNGGKVYVDNTLVSNENYTSKSGSTIITLKKEFVDTLSVGEHSLKVEFKNGGIAETKFTVAKVTENNSEQTETKVDNSATSTEVKENTKKEEKNINNPKTSDMGIVPYIVTVIIATIGLVFVIRRKKTN